MLRNIWLLFKEASTHTPIFILILMVSPALKLRSNRGFAASSVAPSFSISWLCFTHLKWSWRATFKSKLSDRSANPTPIKAARPESSWMRTTKYLEESLTASIAIPGYVSTGHLANNSPLTLSSNFRMHSVPLANRRIRPVQSGVDRFQSAALHFTQFQKQICNLELR